MEVYKPPVRMPPGDRFPEFLVFHRLLSLQEPAQTSARPYVIAGEHGKAPQSAQKSILRSPRAYALELIESVQCLRFLTAGYSFQIDRSPQDSIGQGDQGQRLVSAVPYFPQLAFGKERELLRTWKGLTTGRSQPARSCQPVEQCYPDGQGKLLTGDSVYERLEQARETRRFYAPESFHKGTDLWDAGRRSGKIHQDRVVDPASTPGSKTTCVSRQAHAPRCQR